MPFFSLYLNIRGLQKDPGKFFMGSWKVLEKSWIFLSVKECEPCGGGIEKNDDDVQPSVGL